MTPEQHQQWANAWEEWAATFIDGGLSRHVAQFTRVERQAFYRTLCAIRALPEVKR